MSRISWISAVSCTALLAGVVASSCGDTSSIDNGTGGAAAGMGGHGTGGAVIAGTGGMTTPPPGTGGRATGTGGRQVVDAGPPPADGGPTGCVTNAACTTGCMQACTVNGMTGTRACTCGATGRLTCPIGGGSCMVMGTDGGPPPMDAAPPPADGGPAVCVANAMCTTGCTQACFANGMMGTRDCTCGANGMLTCPTGGASCMVAGRDAAAD